jgi:2-polyprenyl-6-methoxyphenol hydroxylase-like FAD-dependent oxidoreductase
VAPISAQQYKTFCRCLGSDEQIHCSPIEWIEHDHWHTSRVVLIGDAAHATSPMMGHGGCLAMEDAWVLAETLGEHASIDAALRKYVEPRRPRVNWVQEQSRAVGDSFRIPVQARNTVLRDRGSAMQRQRYQPLIAVP